MSYTANIEIADINLIVDYDYTPKQKGGYDTEHISDEIDILWVEAKTVEGYTQINITPLILYHSKYYNELYDKLLNYHRDLIKYQ